MGHLMCLRLGYHLDARSLKHISYFDYFLCHYSASGASIEH